MTLRRVLAMCALTWVTAWAQNTAQAPPIQIRGVVTEIGLGGLAAAQVTAYEFAGPEREKRVVASTVTGQTGAFSFDLAGFGDYWVEVKKDAYVASMTVDGPGAQASQAPQKPRASETGTLVTVSAEHPRAQVRLTLMRPGSLSGAVLDENDKPVESALVELWMAGAPDLSRSVARTGKDGVFQTRGLMPGEYIVRISPRLATLSAPVGRFSEEDLTSTDDEPQILYWPGATDQASATPARVYPGAEASLGTVHMRKTPSYRVRVSVGGCQPGNLPALSVVPRGAADPIPVSLLQFGRAFGSCDDLLVRGMKPGSYTFLLLAKGESAAAQVDIGNKNAEVKMTLAPTAVINGGFLPGRDDLPMPDLSKVRVQFTPAENGAGNVSVSAPDAKGAFVAKVESSLGERVACTGLGDQFYVKEIRVDGQTAPDGVVHLYSGSKLEIVLDDRPASLTGSVTDQGESFSQPLIFLIQWPSHAGPIQLPITGDNSGQFHINGLAPGEYRVLAVPSTSLPDGEQIKFAMLGRLWNTAESFTIERGGSKELKLSISNPLE